MASDLEEDKVKIRQILSATIASLCNNGLNFNLELRIEGLLGITLDKECVFLVNINEVLFSKKGKSSESLPKKTGLNKSYESPTRSKNMNDAGAGKGSCSTQVKNEPQSPQHSTNLPKGTDSFKDSKSSVKVEPVGPKVVTERLETQCLSMQQHGGGYAEVQKSVKTVQHPEGVVEEKQVEWKTYDADGRVLDHQKVEAVQTLSDTLPSNSECDPCYVTSDMTQQDYGNQGSSNKMYGDSREEYYYDEAFSNYPEEYNNDNSQSYFDPNSQGYDYNQNGQMFSQSVRGQRAGQKGAKNARGNSSRAGTKAEGRYHATTSCNAEKMGNIRNPNPKQYRQPPPKKQSFQQPKPHLFQGHYSQSQPQIQVQNVKSPTRGRQLKGNNLLKRAMELVTEGKMSAGTAINLFGIPRSTFYKELSSHRKKQEFQNETFTETGEWAASSGESMEFSDYTGYEGYQ